MARDPQPPGRTGGQRQTRGDNFGGDMANGPSSSSAGLKGRREPQTGQSSSSPSSNSFAADSGLLPIVRHSPSRVSIFIISAGVASHSGGVGARRGLLGRRCGEGTSIGSVGGISVACGSCMSGCGGFTCRATRVSPLGSLCCPKDAQVSSLSFIRCTVLRTYRMRVRVACISVLVCSFRWFSAGVVLMMFEGAGSSQGK